MGTNKRTVGGVDIKMKKPELWINAET